MADKIYVVTNSTISGNYTPNVYKDEKAAWDAFYDLGISDAIDAFDDDMQEAFIQQITKYAKDIIAEIKELMEEHEAESEIMAGEDLPDDKDEKYVKRAKEIIAKFNEAMEKGEIPFRLEDDGTEAWDYISDFESFIDDFEDESFYLEDLVKGKEEEYLDFFGEHVSNIEVKNKKILLEYGYDNFNCIEFFETSIIK